MGIRFLCPNGHKLNVKAFLAGRRGICPFCGAKFQIPTESTIQPGQSSAPKVSPDIDAAPTVTAGSGESTFEQNLEAHLQQAERVDSTAPAHEGSVAQSASPTGQSALLPGVAEQAPSSNAAEATVSNSAVAGGAGAEAHPAPPAEHFAASTSSAAPPQAASPADPLAEVPSAVWYVRPPSGGQYGPAQAQMMRGWLNEGRVSPETLVWREGWADWQEAGSVFSQLQPAPAATAAPPVATVGNGKSAAPYRTGPRRRKSGPSMGLIIVLVAAVLLLLVVLIVILTRDNNGSAAANDGSLAVFASCGASPAGCCELPLAVAAPFSRGTAPPTGLS